MNLSKENQSTTINKKENVINNNSISKLKSEKKPKKTLNSKKSSLKNEIDLSFERSEVEADIKGHIDSIKNPICGHITADSIGEMILEEEIVTIGKCEIVVKQVKKA